MAVVVDANLLVVLVTRDPRRPQVAARFEAWSHEGESLHAPELMPYEVANAVAGLLATGTRIDLEDLEEVWRAIRRVPVTLHRLGDGPEAVRFALQLERRSVYDAAYIALAQRLGTELWTLDGPLARNAASHGLPVALLESER